MQKNNPAETGSLKILTGIMHILAKSEQPVNIWQKEAEVQRTAAMHLMYWLELIAEHANIPLTKIHKEYLAILDGKKTDPYIDSSAEVINIEFI